MALKLSLIRVGVGAGVLGALGVAYFLRHDPPPPAMERPTATRAFPPREPATRTAPVAAHDPRDHRQADPSEPETGSATESNRWRNARVEDLREAIYELEIDSVDRLDLLEEFVETGDADTREFLDTDWAGVDDFKRYDDGFRLEKLEDGRLVFLPGEETRRAYTFFENKSVYSYDEETQEFFHEFDYYGKPMVNVVKFLRQDVMVMMTVSGQKVDLNIYELDSR